MAANLTNAVTGVVTAPFKVFSSKKDTPPQQQTGQQAQDTPKPAQPQNVASDTTNTVKESTNQANPQPNVVEPPTAQEPAKKSGFLAGIQNVGTTVTSGITTGVTSGVTATADLAKGGATLARDATSAGFDISQKVAKAGLNTTTSVVGGTADLAGTAVGGIVNTAAETSGKVFQPVASGLKSIQGFEKLGEGLESLNGVPVAAVKQVGGWTMKALNMSGMTPTFFDTDGDGIVRIEDTTRGLIVLGLDEKNARYAAYALHVVFSYPTGTSWVPTDITLPITIANMSRTRWGRNWGGYDRMEWVEDVDVETFFAKHEEGGETWQQKFKKGRQYFGILLLIFEWGTTFPFWLPDLPAQEIPFKDDIGTVVRKLIVPTIFANFQRAREADPHAGSKPPAKAPSENAPTDPKDA